MRNCDLFESSAHMIKDQEIIDKLDEDIISSIESLKKDLTKLRTGRAHASILDNIRFEYYGASTPLNQCASISTSGARLLTVKPFDRSVIGAIEKAIIKANIGINPQNDGEVIRLPIPVPTEDRRKDLTKQAKSRSEEARISIREYRRNANDMLRTNKISEDDLKRSLAQAQKHDSS